MNKKNVTLLLTVLFISVQFIIPISIVSAQETLSSSSLITSEHERNEEESTTIMTEELTDETTVTTESIESQRTNDSSVHLTEESIVNTTEEPEIEEPAIENSKALKPGVVLAEGMVVSADFPDNMTLEQYLAQYSYPHLPKAGVTSAYRSAESDLRTLNSSEIALVRNETELIAAIGNANIKGISVMKSFAVSNNSYFGGANRKIILEGNGMLIDFKLTLSTISGVNSEVTIQNLNMYHANYFGAILPTASTSILKFHNVNDYGTQIISSALLPVQISGDFVSRFSTISYTSPIDGTIVYTQYNGQQNFESSNIEFFADSVTTLETYNGTNIDLTAAGNVIVEENAKLNLMAANKEMSYGEGIQGYGISTRYASKFIMEKNSEVTYTYKDPGNGIRDYAGILWFQSAGSSFTMKDGAKMYVNKDSHSGNNGLIHFNGKGTFNLDSGSSIEMNIKDKNAGATAISLPTVGSEFNIVNNSKMKLNMTNTGTGTNPLLNVGGQAKLTVDSGSILDMQATGYQSNLITLGSGTASANTLFTVGEDATLNVHSSKRTNSLNDVVSVGNYATFKIKRLGTFKLAANKARNIFSVGSNSTFQFFDAKFVDFGFTENPDATSSLINMSGSAGKFLIDIQHIKAWKRTSSALVDDKPDFDWNPMYGLEIPYSGNIVTSANLKGNSTTAGVAESFKTNFKTGPTIGFQRLVFEFIPDVTVSIDNSPVDNPNDENSRIIRGTTKGGAYVRLVDEVVAGGYSSFPAENNKIPNPAENLSGSDTKNFTTQADSSGKFEFEVPNGNKNPFVAGNEITAYAFLDGKSDTDKKVVLDTTAPTATAIEQMVLVNSDIPDAKSFVPNLTDSNPNGKPVASYLESEEVLSEYLSVIGQYDITIRAVDVAGNEATFPTKLTVVDKSHDLTGQDVTLKITEIEDLSKTEFEELLKRKVNASAYSLIGGILTDLTNKISYDFSTVSQSAGDYSLRFSLSETDSGVVGGLTYTVKVTIGALNPTSPVDPDNPGAGTPPPGGTENSGTGATGSLRIDYAPSSINFGSIPFSYTTTTHQAKLSTNTEGQPLDKQWIQVSDNRSDGNGWSVKAEQIEAFKDDQGNELKGTTLTIPKGTIYNSEVTGSVDTDGSNSKMIAQEGSILSGTSATLFGAHDAGNDSIGKNISTYQWDPTKVTISIPRGTAKTKTKYQTTINWSLTSEATQ